MVHTHKKTLILPKPSAETRTIIPVLVCIVLAAVFLCVASMTATVSAGVSDLPTNSYSLRAMHETDRVLEYTDGMLVQGDWNGGLGQYFRLDQCKKGALTGYRLVHAVTGQVFGVEAPTAGARVAPVAKASDLRQIWVMKYKPNGSMELLCGADKRYALSVKGGSKTPGAEIVLTANAHKAKQQWALAPGTIQSATIGSDRKTLTVTASFTRLLPSDTKNLYLAALPAYCASPRVGKILASVVASTAPILQADMSDPTLLQKKLVIVRKYKGRYSVVSNGFFVTNPEACAANTAPFPVAETAKGLKLTMSEPALKFIGDGNVSHAVIDFPLEAFLLGRGHPYTYGGKTYDFSNAIDGYTYMLKKFHDTGVVVTGVFYLTDRRAADCILPAATKGSGYQAATAYALNTSNKNRRKVEALFSCLAEAFTGNGIYVANWIYGNEVGNYGTYHYAGDVPYALYHESLSDGFRLFNTAIKSKWANARTYLSLDHNWNLAAEPGWMYNGMRLTDSFHKDLAGEGLVHWDMAMHPYPSPEMDCRFWRGSPYVTWSGDTQQVTPRNAGKFARYIKETYGEDIHVILSETGLCAIDGDGTERLDDQAAAVALAYYIAEFDTDIDMIGFHREMDEPGSPWILGLYGFSGMPFSDESARPAAEVFKYMDTPSWKKKTGKYAKIAGGKDWPEVLASFGYGFYTSKLCNS